MSDVEREMWVSLDRRLNDHDSKISNAGRDYTELKNEIRQMMERINMGVSPTQNKILEKQSNIERQISDMDHKLEKSLISMEATVKSATDGMNMHMENFEKTQVKPLAARMGRMEAFWFYTIVGSLVVFGGQKVLTNLWDRITGKAVSYPPPQIESTPVKRK